MERMFKTEPELEVEIYYLTTEEGGRKMKFYSGYSGQLFYDGQDWDVIHELIDTDVCNPGDTVKVYLRTENANAHVGKFFVGKKFEIRERAKTVGKGKITKIIRSGFSLNDESEFKKTATEIIDEYLEKIFKHYLTLDGIVNFDNFLRKEIRCIDEALNLIDLSLLPLSDSYIEECRMIARKSLESEDFKRVNKKLRLEIIDAIFKIKRYTEMTHLERSVYDAFLNLFSYETEAGDLYIELFAGNIFHSEKDDDFLPILQKHFEDIIEK
jgi:hypothetical protein